MRHQHAGLAIPDFPLAYGRLWPATDPASIDHYNQQRIEITSGNPITAFQIELQMVHRLLAALVLTGVALSAWITRPSGARRSALPVAARRLALGWLGLIGAQVVLGACTIWTNKAADVATAHVLVGALSLAAGSFLCIISFRRPAAVLARSANRIPSSGSARADALPGTAAAAHLS
jgi:cytochrome c oxidase assembly protein subunit 15